MALDVHCFLSGPLKTNAYLITSNDKALVIDPAPGSAEGIIPFIKDARLKLEAILLTHSHWDHIADIEKIKTAFQAPIYIHPLDRGNLENPGSDGITFAPPMKGVKPDHLLADGDRIPFDRYAFRVIHTPGHSPGGVCFFEQNEGILMSGDTLFKGSIGNLSLPTSEPERMWPSLDRLACLPPKTRVYPGHGPSTTIGAEPWLPKSREIFA